MPIKRDPHRKPSHRDKGRGDSTLRGPGYAGRVTVQDLRTLGSRQMQEAMREKGFRWVEGQGWVKAEPEKGNRK